MGVRILSLDGGGIRGLMTAVWLNCLEKKLGGNTRDYFDLVAGTSTGSILACGVSHGIPAQDIISLYINRGQDVFPTFENRWWERVQRTFKDGFSAPRYDGKGLNSALQEVFGNLKFGDLSVQPTLAVSYNTFTRSAVVFKNTLEHFAELPVWEVVRSSASAPTYFPAHVIKLPNGEAPLIDGGVVANNPTATAVAEAIRHTRMFSNCPADVHDYIVASFGTGQNTRRISKAEALEWGALQWALPVLDVLMDGASDSVDFISQQILNEDKYYRFQCKLEQSQNEMDNASPENMASLIATAEEYLEAGAEKQMTLLANQLIEEQARRNNPEFEDISEAEEIISIPIKLQSRERDASVEVDDSELLTAIRNETVEDQQTEVAQETTSRHTATTQTVPVQNAPTHSDVAPELFKMVFRRQAKNPNGLTQQSRKNVA